MSDEEVGMPPSSTWSFRVVAGRGAAVFPQSFEPAWELSSLLVLGEEKNIVDSIILALIWHRTFTLIQELTQEVQLTSRKTAVNKLALTMRE